MDAVAGLRLGGFPGPFGFLGLAAGGDGLGPFGGQPGYTSPRLYVCSPLPGSGKTTVLEHLERLAADPLSVASLGSAAMLPRALAPGPRTVLLDEADKNLRPDREGVQDMLAVLNSGYSASTSAGVQAGAERVALLLHG